MRNLEFDFPGQGFEDCMDQFMLGENILVAPMLEKGNYRKVSFPKGIWKDKNGVVINGPVKKQFYLPLDEWFRNN